jgi:hypothetical protein
MLSSVSLMSCSRRSTLCLASSGCRRSSRRASSSIRCSNSSNRESTCFISRWTFSAKRCNRSNLKLTQNFLIAINITKYDSVSATCSYKDVKHNNNQGLLGFFLCCWHFEVWFVKYNKHSHYGHIPVIQQFKFIIFYLCVDGICVRSK